ncbi:hypothetical protein I204_03085 [Kwoniella mangroviensis CBS 8886]|uniref:uncharacterized protein n=1 Tax=Kwoniella mangroviensis CBS 8507 TaxID=1296122 RepID=UPI00080CD041|nr:uncharacterized protein I203_00142 [Kwoniella mangroviensis CBS 8507]OCF70013.1 hypothetical protein I203_00142 [Kwoniella mangroviensis CBS 8507]OCF75791.1 hypothetical protein I204_03085 [Kwoniella mangroviensis CBS 8886]
MTSSTLIGFIPKHAQPFSLEEAMGLEVETLVNEIKRLENSIKHLQRTQSDLRSYLEEDEDGDGEIGKAYMENEDTISSQSERITLIKLALINKLGSDARLEHYGLSIDQPKSQSNGADRSSQPLHQPQTQSTNHGNDSGVNIDIDRLPRNIVEDQGGGSAAPASDEPEGGLHL